MLNRRHALSVLGAMGIGTATFHRALATGVDAACPVTSEMVAQAEWVAGIELNSAQREAVVKSLNEARKSAAKIHAVRLENSQAPGLLFVPLASPAARPDPRGYQVVESPRPAADALLQPDSDDDLAFASIRRLGALLRGRKISSVELTKFYLDRLRRYDPLLKCVVTLTDDLALRQADEADRELRQGKDRGPLHGIPWGMKDVLAYPGYPTTWGAPQHRQRVIDAKAAVAERLDQAGAVLVAKLATNPYAGGGELWYRGLTRNPWNPRQSAAGSSAGSASATAAGLVGFSIATETSYSIQGPAIRCGAVGLRPTYGRVSRFGCMQLCWSLDKIGPICRTADDCGLVLAAIHGADPRDTASVDRKYVWPSSRDVSTIRVGFNPEKGDDKREDLRVIRDLGAKLTPVRFAGLAEYDVTHELIDGVVTIESAATFEDLTRRGGPRGVQGWPRYWLHAHFMSGEYYLKINRLRAILMQRFDEMMQSVDVYVGNDLAVNDNLTGHPKVVFPRAFEAKGGHHLPRPQVLTGRVYDESTLLALAHACQQALGLEHRPPLDRFLAEKDQLLQDEKFPDENTVYFD
jgi:Asp-tRNA(Asn)/Glu-tRNA(Gln) amidotransferase A subunit family amidase